MALLGENTDYTDKDFDSLRARLINLIRGAFPEWTDFGAANFGNILMELFAFVGDVLLYYQDNQAREAFIVSAQLRRSLLSLAKLIGYVPSGNVAATTELVFTLGAPPVGSVVIAEGDTFRTLEVTNPIVFQVLSPVTILPGAVPPSVVITVEHSENRQEVLVSDDTPNQEFQLLDIPYLSDSLSILVGAETWTEVVDFLDSTAIDKHFVVVVDENERATVRFGNGVNGVIPTGTIAFNYKVGGGVTGNVLPNTIVKADKTYYDSFANLQTVSVTNENAATGGANRQSIESIRQLAPRSLRTLTRTVSREDYETNALRVPGVARALMVTSNEKAGVPENQGELYIIPEGGGLPSQALKDAVLTMVTETYPNTLTFLVSVLDPVLLYVDIVCTVYLADGAKPVEVDTAIRTALAYLFALNDENAAPNPNIGFGFQMDGEVAYSDVYNAIRDSAGVRKMSDTIGALQINGEANDLEVPAHYFPTLRYITIYNGDTGYQLVEFTG